MTRTCFRAVTCGEKLRNVEPQKQCALLMVAVSSRFQRGRATSWIRLSARWSGGTAPTTRLVEWMASQWFDRAGSARLPHGPTNCSSGRALSRAPLSVALGILFSNTHPLLPPRMNARFLLLVLIVVGGCSREQTNAATAAVGKSYNLSYRDNVIKNWQAKVSSSTVCALFKDRFRTAGERYDNAANGAFVNDMMKIWEETKSAGCAAG